MKSPSIYSIHEPATAESAAVVIVDTGEVVECTWEMPVATAIHLQPIGDRTLPTRTGTQLLVGLPRAGWMLVRLSHTQNRRAEDDPEPSRDRTRGVVVGHCAVPSALLPAAEDLAPDRRRRDHSPEL